MGKWAKPNLSNLENDLLNNSIKSISWQLINIIPENLYAKNKEKLSNRFWENCQKVEKYKHLTSFWPWKITFRAIHKINFLAVHQYILLGKFHAKIGKSYQTVFEKIASKWKMGQIWPLWPLKMTVRTIKPNPYFTVHGYHPKEATCQNRSEVFETIKLLSEKRRMDDDWRLTTDSCWPGFTPFPTLTYEEALISELNWINFPNDLVRPCIWTSWPRSKHDGHGIYRSNSIHTV